MKSKDSLSANVSNSPLYPFLGTFPGVQTGIVDVDSESNWSAQSTIRHLRTSVAFDQELFSLRIIVLFSLVEIIVFCWPSLQLTVCVYQNDVEQGFLHFVLENVDEYLRPPALDTCPTDHVLKLEGCIRIAPSSPKGSRRSWQTGCVVKDTPRLMILSQYGFFVETISAKSCTLHRWFSALFKQQG